MNNSHVEGRRSLISVKSAITIAESTSLNANGKSSPTQFRWGNNANSSLHSSKTRDASICMSKSCVSNQNSSVSIGEPHGLANRIEPRVYTDVQSKGLASRIVKYHEKGARLNRSSSLNKLYEKPNQFPSVYLKKAELPQRATCQNLSITRIAPPEKSLYYGNMPPSILSNPTMDVQNIGEEISNENRPILHPPQTKNDLAPTRSVLEVLKEISRKRINNEHSETNENTKKYCDRMTNDHYPFHTAQNAQQSKRLREQQTSQHYTNGFSSQHSPEQMPNKRLCSYNNDITSSLSSSQIHAHKRKLYERQHENDGCASPTKSLERDNVGAKRAQLELLPGQDSVALRSERASIDEEQRLQRENPQSAVPASTKSVNCSISDTSAPNDFSHMAENVSVHLRNKPNLTLFNANYDKRKEEVTLMAKQAEANRSDFSAIPFVKPKGSISTNLKNAILEKTQKSKLALMLSGLRGELYNDDEKEDVLDGGIEFKNTSSAQQCNDELMTKSVTNNCTNKVSTPKTIDDNPTERNSKTVDVNLGVKANVLSPPLSLDATNHAPNTVICLHPSTTMTFTTNLNVSPVTADLNLKTTKANTITNFSNANNKTPKDTSTLAAPALNSRISQTGATTSSTATSTSALSMNTGVNTSTTASTTNLSIANNCGSSISFASVGTFVTPTTPKSSFAVSFGNPDAGSTFAATPTASTKDSSDDGKQSSLDSAKSRNLCQGPSAVAVPTITSSSLNNSISTGIGFSFGIKPSSGDNSAAVTGTQIVQHGGAGKGFNFGAGAAAITSAATVIDHKSASSSSNKFTFGQVSSANTFTFGANNGNASPFSIKSASTETVNIDEANSSRVDSNLFTKFNPNNTTFPANKASSFSFGNHLATFSAPNAKPDCAKPIFNLPTSSSISLNAVSASPQNKTFTFGGSHSNNLNTPTTNNNVKTFATLEQTSSPLNVVPTNVQSKTFAFGAHNNSLAPINNGDVKTTTTTTTASGFSFNSDKAKPSTIFAFGGLNSSAAPINNAVQSPSSLASANSNGQMAAVSRSVSNVGDRPFRRATRRLQKS